MIYLWEFIKKGVITMLWKNIKPLCTWVNLAVPTVFGDSLSYLEDLGKVNYKLNELIGGFNQIPDFVAEQIEQSFDDSGIAEKIKEILSSTQLDVTNPPNHLPAADKTGNTDSTQALQSIIDYATNLTLPQNLYFPAGVYMVSSLILRPNVSFTGDGSSFTTIKQQNFASGSMITGNLQNALLQGLSFYSTKSAKDNNNFIALNDCSNCGIKSSVFTSNNDNLNISGNAFICDNTFYNTGIRSALTESGILNNSFYIVQTAIINTGDNVTMLNQFYDCNQLIDNSGNHCQFSGYNDKDNAIYTNTGEHFYFDIPGIATEKVYKNSTTNITNNKTEKIGEYDIEIDNEFSEVSNSKIEIVTNGKEENFGDLTTQIQGTHKTVTDTSLITAQVIKVKANEVAASAQSFKLNGNLQVDKNLRVEGKTNLSDTEIQGNVTATSQVFKIKSEDVIINSVNPLTYGVPQRLNETYKYVPFKNEKTGDNYQVMVYDGKDPAPPTPGETHKPTYINIKDYGAKGDGVTDDTNAFQAAAGFNGYIYLPFGTYLVDTLTLPDNIRGIIGEMSTIKSSTSGDMITAQAAMFYVQSVILDAANAASALTAANGGNLDSMVSNRNIHAGTLFMRGCRINNNCTIASGNTSITGCILNANITLKQGFIYEITGNSLSGSFVVEVEEGEKVAGAAITGNHFTTPITLSDTYFTLLRISGNNNLEDYPKIVIPDPPEPTPPFDYTVPNSTALKFMGTSEDNNYQIYCDSENHFHIRPLNSESIIINESGLIDLFHTLNIVSGNINISTSNTQKLNFKNYDISQNNSDEKLVITSKSDPMIVLNYPNINEKNIVFNATSNFNNNININQTNLQALLFKEFHFGQIAQNNVFGLLYNNPQEEVFKVYRASNTAKYFDVYYQAIFNSNIVLPINKAVWFNGYNYNNSYYIYENANDHNLYFMSFNLNPYKNEITAYIKPTGEWVFNKPISAPNLSGGGATYLGGINKTLSKESTYPISLSYLGIDSVPQSGSIVMLVILSTGDYSGTIECTARYNPGQVDSNVRYIGDGDTKETFLFSLWCPASNSAPNAHVNLALYKLN